jgi:hypothetical protein
MSKILMALVIVILMASTCVEAQNCALSGTAVWSPQLRNVIADCNNRFPSPDNRVTLEVGIQGGITLLAKPDSRKLELNVRRIEAPAMVAWSPTSDAFFVNDGEGSGMSSVFRLFRVNANHVLEDESIEKKAVALHRAHCHWRAADPNVWGFGWTPDGRTVFVLVQATTNDPCGRSESFVTLVVSETDGAILETLSKEKSRERFAPLLPPELFGR